MIHVGEFYVNVWTLAGGCGHVCTCSCPEVSLLIISGLDANSCIISAVWPPSPPPLTPPTPAAVPLPLEL